MPPIGTHTPVEQLSVVVQLALESVPPLAGSPGRGRPDVNLFTTRVWYGRHTSEALRRAQPLILLALMITRIHAYSMSYHQLPVQPAHPAPFTPSHPETSSISDSSTVGMTPSSTTTLVPRPLQHKLLDTINEKKAVDEKKANVAGRS